MSDTTNRRNFLWTGVAFAGLGFTSQTALAGVFNRSDRLSEQFLKELNAVRYSQAEFMKLNRHELTYLYNYKINGFYDAMAKNVVHMTLADRASMHRLMRDMAKLETADLRNARLLGEMRSATERQDTLGQSNNRNNGDEKRRLRRAKIYKRGVKAWQKYPREGTFFTPCLFAVGSFAVGCTPTS